MTMIVTKVQPLDKKRNIVYVDDRVAFVLYKGDLFTYRIEEDTELSDDTYNKICEEVLKKRALLRLGHLLEKRDYTERQLRDKLHEGYYPDDVIEYAVNKVIGYGFVDDKRYTSRYIECYLQKKSKQRIKSDLFTKGIGKDIIEAAFCELEDDGLVQDEAELIRDILRKRHYYEKEHTMQENAKQFNYLMSKGFSLSAIKNELKLDITS